MTFKMFSCILVSTHQMPGSSPYIVVKRKHVSDLDKCLMERKIISVENHSFTHMINLNFHISNVH